MAYNHPDWIAHQRQRWLRPDWQRFVRPDAERRIRPDAHRFAPPGTPRYHGRDVARYFWPHHPLDRADQKSERTDALDATNDVAAQRDARFEHELADARRALQRIRDGVAAVAAEIKFRRFLRDRKAGRFRDLKAGFRQEQLRDDHGRWTDEAGRNDPRIISDAIPDNEAKPGAQYAANRSGRGAQRGEAEPGQAARLAVAEARARDAVRRVQELDPKWKPTPSIHETVEGKIAAAEAEAREAEARLRELARNGIGPGPFAGESIPARGPERTYRTGERRDGLRILSETGCHTCGTFDAGTSSGYPVLDHQPPTALNFLSKSQRLFPQCLRCSLRQGGWITHNK